MIEQTPIASIEIHPYDGEAVKTSYVTKAFIVNRARKSTSISWRFFKRMGAKLISANGGRKRSRCRRMAVYRC